MKRPPRKSTAKKRLPNDSHSVGALGDSGPSRLSMDDIEELRSARALWARNQTAAALEMFDAVVRTYPGHVRALVDASRAFGAAWQSKRAEDVLERLLAVAEGRSDILHLAGQSYRLLRRTERAEQVFKMAIRSGNPLPDTYLELALLCERRGDLEQALEYLRMRARRVTDDPEIHVVRTRVLRRMHRESDSLDLLRRVTQGSAHWLTQMRAWSEMAIVYDKLEEYDKAWQAMLDGKAVAAGQTTAAQQHRDQIMPALWSLCESLPTEMCERWASESRERSTPQMALLTGMPRSGTTLLASLLDAHPDVISVDEIGILVGPVLTRLLHGAPFSAVSAEFLRRLEPAHVRTCGDQYQSLFVDWLKSAETPSRVVVDKNPSLLPLLPLFRLVAPHAPLAVMIRDPRDTLLSCLFSYFPPVNDVSVDFASPLTAAVRIARDLECWIALRTKIGGPNVAVRYEALVSEPRTVLIELLAAWGLPWHEGMLNHQQFGRDGKVHSPSFDSVINPIHDRSVGRWRNYARHLEPVLGHLSRVIADLGYSN